PVRRRAAQGSWLSAQRASSTDSSRLFERSEQSERSEFRDAATRPSSAAQSARRADCRTEAKPAARPRLCDRTTSAKQQQRALNVRNGPVPDPPRFLAFIRRRRHSAMNQ
ncbi:hypothetical protein, partial [Methylibium sp.]|uniref:hypothetical protein n=1 Tax=Methylibium sp. TaxID=2067992 RepID=UPI0025E95466